MQWQWPESETFRARHEGQRGWAVSPQGYQFMWFSSIRRYDWSDTLCPHGLIFNKKKLSRPAIVGWICLGNVRLVVSSVLGLLIDLSCQEHDFVCNLLLISAISIFEDNKIVQASRASAICAYLYRVARESCCYLFIIYMKSQDGWNLGSTCYL